ncbi:hypothetical protein BKA67DRAFT_654050 [Truncatella angustata]|uniref:Uncharacterized protein n=1 Tax=Truncatella angustata TaxID=152316 RepID=A0A9P8UYW5_9PEZI|nr:uncharacterized protein BKA67DRAFT_654050 [Truncatella angustata]KAH6660897.1 hypothetical protein BKA67DRAFT_654050 [Truncatella angustata]KAH8199220.1 hypothetical protein TruAng_006626 [Truncatella angustata]
MSTQLVPTPVSTNYQQSNYGAPCSGMYTRDDHNGFHTGWTAIAQTSNFLSVSLPMPMPMSIPVSLTPLSGHQPGSSTLVKLLYGIALEAGWEEEKSRGVPIIEARDLHRHRPCKEMQHFAYEFLLKKLYEELKWPKSREAAFVISCCEWAAYDRCHPPPPYFIQKAIQKLMFREWPWWYFDATGAGVVVRESERSTMTGLINLWKSQRARHEKKKLETFKSATSCYFSL